MRQEELQGTTEMSIILNMIRMVAPILTTWVLSIYSIICPRGETKLPWKDVYINFILIECSKLHLQRIMICIMLYNYGWNLELGTWNLDS